MIVIGNRFNDIADRYFDNGKKRPLIADLLRLVETENAKRKKNLLLKSAKNAKQRKSGSRNTKSDRRNSKREKEKKRNQNQSLQSQRLILKLVTKYVFSMVKVWEPLTP